jgi:hypothetical protein
MKVTTVFKDEQDLKKEVEQHLSEEKETCGCGCEIGKCECGPECTKCDCGKKKLNEEDKYEEGELPFSLNNSFFGVMADILVEVGHHHNNPEISSLTNFLAYLYDEHSGELRDIRIKDEILIDHWNSIQSQTNDAYSSKESRKSSDQEETSEDWDPTGSVGVSGVSQDVARKGSNTLWEQKEEILKNFKRFL